MGIFTAASQFWGRLERGESDWRLGEREPRAGVRCTRIRGVNAATGRLTAIVSAWITVSARHEGGGQTSTVFTGAFGGAGVAIIAWQGVHHVLAPRRNITAIVGAGIAVITPQ